VRFQVIEVTCVIISESCVPWTYAEVNNFFFSLFCPVTSVVKKCVSTSGPGCLALFLCHQ